METARLIGGERTTVTVNYSAIDDSKTRIEENEERRAQQGAHRLGPFMGGQGRQGRPAASGHGMDAGQR